MIWAQLPLKKMSVRSKVTLNLSRQLRKRPPAVERFKGVQAEGQLSAHTGMRRPEPLGLATRLQLHRHKFCVQLEQPVGRKSLDPVYSPFSPCKPDPPLRQHALPLRIRKYSRKNDWQRLPSRCLLHWRIHGIPCASSPRTLRA